MSIHISTDVFCDRCPAWIHGTTGTKPKAAAARRVAAASGWKRRRPLPGGPLLDLCPECAESTT